MRAIASVESHFNPFAIRDNTARQSWMPNSVDAAARIAKTRLAKGHSVDLGLMQISSANLEMLGITVDEAFDACHSLNAARHILRHALAAGSNETERQAALFIALSRYNTGTPFAGIINGYVGQVISAQSSPFETSEEQKLPKATSQWSIWGAIEAEQTPWVVTADGSPEIERAGAQTSDARDEGRAPASSSEKGEPYELSAYQESEPSKP